MVCNKKHPQAFNENALMSLDSTITNHQPKDIVSSNLPVLQVPLIDIAGFLSGDPLLVSEATRLVSEAAKKHGFFIVTNHGVDEQLLSSAYTMMDTYFEAPTCEKQKIPRKWGEVALYTSSIVEGLEENNLPWKESLSIFFSPENHSGTIKDFFKNKMGDGYKDFGRIYQAYAEAMTNLSINIMELLGMSLGVKRNHFREFFDGGESIFRLNYLPKSKQPYAALGNGAHWDPTSLTILYQNQISGLEAFVDNQWHSILPNRQALMVNIGNTVMALTNGVYKSCLHREMVNSESERKALAFFLCPKLDKVVKPPEELGSERLYPDFNWSTLFEFTTKHNPLHVNNFQEFLNWMKKNKESS